MNETNGITQKMIDTFLLNSVSMASDHVLNGLKDPSVAEKNDFIGTMFKRGLLGQLKLREEYVGGHLDGSFEENNVEEDNEDHLGADSEADHEQYDFWN